jgi:hypothetical protein
VLLSVVVLCPVLVVGVRCAVVVVLYGAGSCRGEQRWKRCHVEVKKVLLGVASHHIMLTSRCCED